MRLDVIIPTYNRTELLERAIASLLAANIPAGLEVAVTVIDNNSKDKTREIVGEWQRKFGGRLNYIFEGRPGKSYALNTGIAATTGELVGMIDDDEEVDKHWFECIRKVFREENVDFIGGPYIPRWGADPPSWLPPDYPAIIGKVDVGDKVLAYDANFPGILMGGNVVIKRSVLERVGPYSISVGRIGGGLPAGEDEDYYRRLLMDGARGYYRPDLVIHHFVPPSRLTKRYHRRWCFWRAASSAVNDREYPEPVVYLCGVPRYLYGRAARGLLRAVKGRLSGKSPAELFSNELAVWDWAGFFYGKNLRRSKPPDQLNGGLVGQTGSVNQI